jgi:hypothetical protein
MVIQVQLPVAEVVDHVHLNLMATEPAAWVLLEG